MRDWEGLYLVVPPGGSFRETRRIELGPAALTIGRGDGCDVRVDVPGVDDEHARVSEVALIAIGPDCAIGDVPLDVGARRLVMPGDEIQIGSVVVAVEGHDPSILPPPPDGVARTPRGPKVRVVEGKNFGDELELREEGKAYVVGRHAACDLVLDDREVSREHLRVRRQGNEIHVQDLSSTRGSWIGRSNVYSGSSVAWERPRMLKLGATVLSLELPRELRKVAPRAQASAPMTPPPRQRRGKPHLALEPASSDGAISVELEAAPPSSGVPSASPVPSTGDVPVSEPISLATSSGGFPSSRGAALAGASVPLAGALAVPGPTRTAWKKSAPVIGKASGALILLVGALAILGAIFLVFSMME